MGTPKDFNDAWYARMQRLIRIFRKTASPPMIVKRNLEILMPNDSEWVGTTNHTSQSLQLQ